MTTRTDFETAISQLEEVSHKYVRSREAWLHRRENLELGRLTENLLPPEVLREILLSAEGEQAFIIDPIEWYYEHVYIVPIWLDNRLIYRTRIPVVSAHAWHYIQIRQWATPVRDYQVTLSMPDVILWNTQTGQLSISPSSYGERPRICRQGLSNPPELHPCITRLLSESPAYDPHCLVILQRRFQQDAVHYLGEDSYILQTGGTELTLRCTGQAEQKQLVKPGVYELSVVYPCTLQGDNWTLNSIFQRMSNVTLETEPVGQVPNVTLTDLPNYTLTLDPSQFQLEDLSPVDRRQIPVSNFIMPTPKILNKSRKHVWHSFWALILAVLAGIAVYVRRHYIQRRSAKLPPEIELQTTEAAVTTVPASPPSSAVFHFTAPQNP